MNRYITSADALKTLKQLLYETALNQFDFDTTEVYEDIAKNRLETWVDLIPTADVVEKERYDILLEHANILAEEMRKYQNADVVERKHGKWIMHIDDLFPAESTMECSECHHEQSLIIDDNFCPNCGAKMDREETEDEIET